MQKICREAAGVATVAAFLLLFPTIVLADIPPTPPPAQSGFDWVTVLTGAVFAFAGALFFVWLGRKLIKR